MDRDAHPSQPPLRLLVVEDQVPVPALGFGHPRGHALVGALLAQGWRLTLYPLHEPVRQEPEASELERRGVEVAAVEAVGPQAFSQFYRRRADDFDAVWISRPRNLRFALPTVRGTTPERPIIYDCEAIAASRELLRRELVGHPMPPRFVAQLLDEELAYIREADLVCAVSAGEERLLAAHGIRAAVRLGHPLRPAPTPRPLAERAGLLFIGSFYQFDGVPRRVPNEDAVEVLLREVFPRVLERHPCRLTIAGYGSEVLANHLDRFPCPASVTIAGTVPSVAPLYDAARVFVATTRFAAGLPWKITEAMALGVPAVVTPVLAEQLGVGEDTVLVGRDPGELADKTVRLLEDDETWWRLRAAGLAYVERECSPERFAAGVRAVGEWLRARLAGGGAPAGGSG